MVKKPLVLLLKTLLLLTAVAVAGLSAAIPLSRPFYNLVSEGRAPAGLVLSFVFITGAMAVWILAELYLVLNTALTDPFVMRNSRAFLRMGLVAEGAAALFFAKCAFEFTPMTAICGFVMLLCGLFAIALSQVFRRAVELKLENDLTI